MKKLALFISLLIVSFSTFAQDFDFEKIASGYIRRNIAYFCHPDDANYNLLSHSATQNSVTEVFETNMNRVRLYQVVAYVLSEYPHTDLLDENMHNEFTFIEAKHIITIKISDHKVSEYSKISIQVKHNY